MHHSMYDLQFLQPYSYLIDDKSETQSHGVVHPESLMLQSDSNTGTNHKICYLNLHFA